MKSKPESAVAADESKEVVEILAQAGVLSEADRLLMRQMAGSVRDISCKRYDGWNGCKVAIKNRTKSSDLGNTFCRGFGIQELLHEFPNLGFLIETEIPDFPQRI